MPDRPDHEPVAHICMDTGSPDRGGPRQARLPSSRDRARPRAPQRGCVLCSRQGTDLADHRGSVQPLRAPVPPHLRRAPRSNRVSCRLGRQRDREGTLDAFDAAIEDLALLAESTAHDGTKLGAIRARLDAVTSRWELMRAVGVLRANLEQLWLEFDAQRVARRILGVLDNHQIPREVQEEIAQAVEQRHANPE
jgi:hypothetical protein